ncbi:uncharacterized protein SAPINGB_P000771 [Magnusiomyces paraingens]|uniref:DUF1749-domain-containing protein n=1 Tax=Magnusiomyces paraingens TaxID=2606893 RepID=A0A5E8B3W0_9ASCO|nr:uncharacterized protein SAPINGB_P000771 [Saprochaete ingens]VVT45501.1 unnamed protein product [Saprochaete ingens]
MTAGRLLNYSSRLTIFEHAPASGSYHPTIVLFIGGLGDGLGTVPYVPALAQALDAQGWGVAELLFSSSYEGWGFGSLSRDAKEMARAIGFLQTNKETSKKRIVLMGHSTGTQNLIYYATQNINPSIPRPPVDGLILQASVSDREAFVKSNGEEKWQEALAYAQDLLLADIETQSKALIKAEAPGFSPIPPKYTRLFFGAQISSYRWVSLMKVRGDDDFFSSDLDDKDFESTFGKVSVPLLVLYSGADEYVPVKVDKKSLVKRFQNATKSDFWSPLSHVVPDATHNLADSPQSSYDDLISSVVAFIQSV